MERTIYGVNRFYYGKRKILDKTDWFFNLVDAEFATTQMDSSKHIIKAIYHDDPDGYDEPWIEIVNSDC